MKTRSATNGISALNKFAGQMSIIGPRPALWNQYDLVAERNRYGANGVKPGLTGWTQVNGRDKRDIPEKAKLDGEYSAALQAGHFQGFAMDLKISFTSIKTVMKCEGVLDGEDQKDIKQ